MSLQQQFICGHQCLFANMRPLLNESTNGLPDSDTEYVRGGILDLLFPLVHSGRGRKWDIPRRTYPTFLRLKDVLLPTEWVCLD